MRRNNRRLGIALFLPVLAFALARCASAPTPENPAAPAHFEVVSVGGVNRKDVKLDGKSLPGKLLPRYTITSGTHTVTMTLTTVETTPGAEPGTVSSVSMKISEVSITFEALPGGTYVLSDRGAGPVVSEAWKGAVRVWTPTPALERPPPPKR